MNLIFESQPLLALYRFLFPDESRPCHALPDLISSFLGKGSISFEQRSAEMEKLLPTEEQPLAPHYLKTIESLREALVLTHDDLDFCLGTLAETPKNGAIRRTAHWYLDHPILSDDFTAHVWEAIEGLRSQNVEGAMEGPVILVRDQKGSLLLDELGKALASLPSVERVQTKEFWELGDSPPRSTSHLYQGSTPVTLSRLGERCERLLSRGVKRILVPLRAKTECQRLLEYQWDHRRLSSANFPEEADIVTVPFRPLPPVAQTSVLAFADSSLFEPVPSLQLLRESEIQFLNLSGFPVAGSGERVRRQELLTVFSGQGAGTQLFTSIKKNELPIGLEKRTVFLKPRLSPLRSRQEAPVKPHVPVLSATQLETYSACPAKYLYRYPLRLSRVAEKPEEKFSLLLGLAAHSALETVFKTRAPLAELVPAFEIALTTTEPELSPENPVRIALVEAFQGMVKHIGEMEDTLRQIFPGSTPNSFEVPFELTWKWAPDLRVVGKIDRIDKTAEGKSIVIDYKTGSVDFTPNHIVQGKHFQALLYLLAVEKRDPGNVAGFLFYDLKQGELRRGILRGAELSPESKRLLTRGHTVKEEEFSRIVEEGLAQIYSVVENIQAGHFAPRPSTECEICEAVPLCRKAEGYA